MDELVEHLAQLEYRNFCDWQEYQYSRNNFAHLILPMNGPIDEEYNVDMETLSGGIRLHPNLENEVCLQDIEIAVKNRLDVLVADLKVKKEEERKRIEEQKRQQAALEEQKKEAKEKAEFERLSQKYGNKQER